MPSSLLEQAQGGDAAAIAALMNQALQSKGVTVRGDRQGDCLQLWLTAPTLPPQAATVAYVRRGLDRLQVTALTVLQIYGGQTDQPQPSWGIEVDLGAATAEIRPLTLEPEPIAQPEIAQPTAASEPADTPSGSAPDTIAFAYAQLGLEPGDSLQKVEGTYFKQKALALREGDRPRVEALKQAFYQLKDHIENPPPVEAAAAVNPEPADPLDDESLTPAQRIEILLKRQGVGAQVSVQGNQLYISWLAVRVINPEAAAQQVHALLTQPNLASMGIEGVETLVISGLSRDHAVVWQQTMTVAKR
ncbi:MAG: hypothetical protein EA368_12970 [Leptolyngbya sp. DLM2.Bin27]|nr:MAG: hypothetical protein EA368_12970 [Leptolyngbya sp. DLM2.Bin27]